MKTLPDSVEKRPKTPYNKKIKTASCDSYLPSVSPTVPMGGWLNTTVGMLE